MSSSSSSSSSSSLSSSIEKYDIENIKINKQIEDIDKHIDDLQSARAALMEQLMFNNASKQHTSAPTLAYLSFDIIKILVSMLTKIQMSLFYETNKHNRDYYYMTNYFQFNPKSSFDYYINKNGMRDIMEKKIDTKKQLSLRFVNNSSIEYASIISNVHSVHLFKCSKMIDVNPFGNVQCLELNSVKGFTDVSGLGSVHTLSLIECHRDKVRDISCLTNVKNLTLVGLRRISDYPNFGACQQLKIDNCKVSKTRSQDFYQQMRHTQNVSISNVDDLDLVTEWHNKALSLSNCTFLSCVSSLDDMEKLTIRNCHDLESVKGINNVRTITLDCNTFLKKLSNISNIETLTISSCPSIRIFENISNVKKLVLSSLSFAIPTKFTISNVREVYLSNIKFLTSVNFLVQPDANIQVLTLSDLSSLTNPGINLLGMIPEVNLIYCNGISDVSALANCRKLKIDNPYGDRKIIAGIRTLGGVQDLELIRIEINDFDIFSIRTVKNVTLKYCGGFKNIKPLASLESLSMYMCDAIKDANILIGKVKTLKFVKDYRL